MIEIRNPHGDSRYNKYGPWGANSKKWTEGFKYQLNYDPKADHQGTFWFEFTDDF
jgi:hypothetical protein